MFTITLVLVYLIFHFSYQLLLLTFLYIDFCLISDLLESHHNRSQEFVILSLLDFHFGSNFGVDLLELTRWCLLVLHVALFGLFHLWRKNFASESHVLHCLVNVKNGIVSCDAEWPVVEVNCKLLAYLLLAQRNFSSLHHSYKA